MNQLEEVVMSALKKEVGSEEAPEMFSCYADTAYEIQQMGYLADISPYISKEELRNTWTPYVEEGRIGKPASCLFSCGQIQPKSSCWIKRTGIKFSQAAGVELSSPFDHGRAGGNGRGNIYDWTDSLTPDIPNDGKAFTAGTRWRICLLSVPCSWGLRFSRWKTSR